MLFIMVYADAITRDCEMSGVLRNGVTTWMYAKMYSRQRVIGVQLVSLYEPSGTSRFFYID